jgi:hypothetical protein
LNTRLTLIGTVGIRQLLEDIKARIADIKCDYDKMNPYLLYFACQALINEVEYWKDRALEAEKQADYLIYY